MDGPNAAPNAPIAPHIPMAAERRDTGNSGSTMANDDGMISDPPMACTTRAAIRISTRGATPLNSEPIAKITKPRLNILRRPWRSASRPDSSRNDPTVME